MRAILVIVALLAMVASPALASDHVGAHAREHHAGSSATGATAARDHDHHRHGKADQSSNEHRYHEVDRSAEPEAHCPRSLAPVHCEVCLDRNAIQASALRQREYAMASRDLRLSWPDPVSLHASGPEGDHLIAARPPDTQWGRAPSSRPLSLAHRFRI